MKRAIAAAGVALLGAAHAGHEFPFYPSFYPQEITIEALDAAAAARRLGDGTLHAYAGSAIPDSGKTAAVNSLGGYVVAMTQAGGCIDARGMKEALAPGQVWHPYPVTPFHPDYLHHADRVEAAGAAQASPAAKVEIVDVDALMAKARKGYNGWSEPPWIRQGWFHAYLLLAPPAPDSDIENAVRRLMRGEYRSLAQRIELERGLVERLQRGCQRAVLGYVLRREHYAVEYSAGVENVGYDSLEGLASSIFPRTVKLRDFPWNGWLNVAAPAAPSSPWNPLGGGFQDTFGRLVWLALSDPAFLPSPHGGAWLDNRVHAKVHGDGKKAELRVVYRVHNSLFHDGTPMSYADLVYAYFFAKPQRPKGVRLLRVEKETLAFGEDKLSYQVPVVEVQLQGVARSDAAAAAPPWTTLPWHLLALLDEGARRGHFKLDEADPVRDAAAVKLLSELALELEERAHVPSTLTSLVNQKEARERYRRLREFHAAHGHWLVTNGPYQLERWDGAKAVLAVFRDPSYPNGLGRYNAYAVPLKAYVTRVERRGNGVEVHLEAERLQREARDVRIVRGAPEKGRSLVCRYVLLGAKDSVAAAGQVRAGADGRCALQLKAGAGRLLIAAVLDDGVANAAIKTVPWE
ncbi:MAG TPA: hypothetical protein VLF65_09300 [Burkholderiales bacterium]|nr:hypothetical protein [Burkholderiales bacterium]